jgi:phosphoglucosamine mutase
MTKQFFGTDGIRGRFGVEPITPLTVLKLGWAVGTVMRKHFGKGQILIGKDTRVSGYILESALEAGISSAGMDVVMLGPVPTPAIAYLTRSARATAGVVISASHNPFHDNGIKFFCGNGFKLNDDFEEEIELMLAQDMVTVDPEELGKASRMVSAAERYIEYCKTAIDSSANFKGLKVALDCANGAAYQVAPKVFKELGASISIMHNLPNGFNINDQCGSTHIGDLQKFVIEEGCDLGIAFDGDADRVLMVDHLGNEVDGDQLLYVLTSSAKIQGKLDGGVVGTLMTNLGLEKRFAELSIPFVRAKVGDRHVLKEMQNHHWKYGGESSGHIICLDKSTTGDGLLSALLVVEAILERQQPLFEIVSEYSIYPQRMINIKLTGNVGSPAQKICDSDDVQELVAKTVEEMGDSGRVLLRASGTEPLIRVMVEGEEAAMVDQCCENLAEKVANYC